MRTGKGVCVAFETVSHREDKCRLELCLAAKADQKNWKVILYKKRLCK